MKCIKPFINREGAFGCGQCLPCRVQKRRTWAHRILLEAMDHGYARCCFVTLTYREDRRELEPIDLQRWLKRFRKRIAPDRVRFLCVGEYGDVSWRPHYHAALFGWPHCQGGIRIDGACQCRACFVVRKTWGFGHVMVGQLTEKSANYIAGYVTKKMTHSSDIRLDGRHPEFARMSLRPGIGANAMWNVASDMMRYSLEARGDVPLALRYGSKLMPLGQYLRRQLREKVGKGEGSPAEALQEAANKLQLLRAFAWQNNRSVASVFQEINQPRADQMAARLALKERKL